MLTGYGSISQAILAVPCRRHWTSYYWMVRKGKFDWKAMVHALCRIVKREFPSERCIVVGDDTLIPRVSEAAPGAAIQYDHARKPNRPDYILAQTVVSLSAVIGNSLGSWSVPLMSNLAVRTGNHGKLETMRAMVEEVSATLGAITLLLDAWYTRCATFSGDGVGRLGVAGDDFSFMRTAAQGGMTISRPWTTQNGRRHGHGPQADRHLSRRVGRVPRYRRHWPAEAARLRARPDRRRSHHHGNLRRDAGASQRFGDLALYSVHVRTRKFENLAKTKQ